MTTRPRCFGLRRLHPFLGVIEVVETVGARALSVDGVHWQLEVAAERPEHGWRSGNSGAPVRQWFGFGRWHRQSGVKGVPLNPLLDIGAVMSAVETLVAELPNATAGVPFALADRYEHWLLDHDRQPLALVAAATQPCANGNGSPTRWRAAPATTNGRCDDGPADDGMRVDHELPWRLDQIEQLIASRSGPATRAHWFERLPDGSARAASGECLPADRFPELGLRREWRRPAHRTLVSDYLDWMAPRLLMLPNLSAPTRAQLERAARKRAELVARYHRLYPVVIDADLIAAARVEARLRSTGAPQPTN